MDQDSDYSYEEHDAAVISPPRIKAEEAAREVAETDLSTGYEERGEPGSEESDYVEEEDEDEVSSGAESQELRSPLKRPLDDAAAVYRPFKRQRGELNFGYLELLNQEIQDAAQQSSFADQDLPPASQIGLTYWSAPEKQIFFEVVARLGKHDLPGIATKIGSKSVAEVSHYLNFLQEACDLRQQQVSRSILEIAEYPAAVEISQQCCHAQEEAADEISIKQEAREELRERNRWGDVWDITPKVAKKLSKDVQAQDANLNNVPQFAQLFHLSKWLELSARMFMNSSVPGNNWNSIDEEPPSMWATTFEDFHSLATSVTRRLIQTTLFIAMSRIRSRNAMGSKVRDMVQLQDAEAAISSLNMTSKANELWVNSARRLRLDVYTDPPEGDEEYDEERMTYEEVELALSSEATTESRQQARPDTPFSTQQSHAEDEEDSFSDMVSDLSRSPSPTNEEEQEINKETMEVLEYSITDIRTDKATRKALKACIATDRQKERQAEEIDQYASYKAEVEMWSVLQKKPPMELPKKHDPGPSRRSNLSLDSFYPSGRDWARKLLYYSEWETLPQPELEPRLRLEHEETVEKEAGDEGSDEAEEGEVKNEDWGGRSDQKEEDESEHEDESG
ncbi:rna polymerase i-specific transcription initiation factor rrn5 [Trichoderma arundinaceum]|uniref:Rna polymerase i-specific transcription initiation factor rrn5 n=1 Tax=Trichoderma arundinaceum TaxID=490622 RepID=A0A395NZX6_TRIAR|nr:rna polymerase i-specific transcription initiation factor rrn5 [Trichoderma arundinaceum]